MKRLSRFSSVQCRAANPLPGEEGDHSEGYEGHTQEHFRQNRLGVSTKETWLHLPGPSLSRLISRDVRESLRNNGAVSISACCARKLDSIPRTFCLIRMRKRHLSWIFCLKWLNLLNLSIVILLYVIKKQTNLSTDEWEILVNVKRLVTAAPHDFKDFPLGFFFVHTQHVCYYKNATILIYIIV